MSGSEDDFASADEGESEPDGIQRSTGLAAVSVKPARPAKEGVIKDVASRSVTTSEASGHSKGDPAAGDAGGNVGDTHKQSSGGNSKKRRQKKGSAQIKGSEISVASIEAVGTSECVEKVENDKLEADAVQKTTDIEVTHKVYEAPLSISDLKPTTDSSEELTKPPSTPEKRVPDHDSSENLDNTAHANHEAEAEAAAMAKSPSSQDIPRSKPDHTTQQEEVLDSLTDAVKDNQKKSGWGWGWGSSLLDVASTSVSTFKSQVGEGFSTVMETVESTLKLPSPEEMAASRGDVIPGMDLGDSKEPQPDTEETLSDDAKDHKEQVSEDSSTDNKSENPVTEERSRNPSGGNWFSTWGVSNITSAVQHTVTGGLDVLETLGKKTFDVIKDHDPGLKKTKGLLFERGDKQNLSQNLSQMLRDAKEQSDAQTQLDHETEEARKAHFGSLFDDFQGLAHLEALEILSNQSERKLNSLLTALGSDTIAEIKPRLLQIKGHFEMDDEEETDVEEQDFVKLVTDILGDLAVGTTPDKLVQTQKQAQQSMDSFKIGLESDEKPIPKEMHRVAISSLAELTSRSMEQFHKVGELILLHCSQPTDFVTCSGHLASLTKVLCSEVGIMSAGFTQCLNKCADGEEASSVNTLVTNVYLEAANSSSYIQDGFQLLLPVLQQAAVENTQGGS